MDNRSHWFVGRLLRNGLKGRDVVKCPKRHLFKLDLIKLPPGGSGFTALPLQQHPASAVQEPSKYLGT